MKMIVSYADPEQDHHGGVYQATNWIYLGITKGAKHFKSDKGFNIHSKSLCTGNKGLATKLLKEGKIISVKKYKHKYIYPLEKNLWNIYKKQSKQYPTRVLCNSSMPTFHVGGDVQVDPPALLKA